jgi:hypothetical protein
MVRILPRSKDKAARILKGIATGMKLRGKSSTTTA